MLDRVERLGESGLVLFDAAMFLPSKVFLEMEFVDDLYDDSFV